tara:strand:+ start:494 stop:967 length:474 start_codon:yes stop_codon:yes gene_type:complete
MTHIHANKRDTKEYTVTVAYVLDDGHDDKSHMHLNPDDEPIVFHIIVPAESNQHAIQRAMEIVLMSKAEDMTDYISGHPFAEGKDSLTKEEIDDIQKSAVESLIFRNWLSIEPTSIQCHLTQDEEKLFDLTQVNITKLQESIGTRAEDFLKEISDDA